MRNLVSVLLLSLVCASFSAALDLPGGISLPIPDEPTIPIAIPGLDRILKEEPWITTGLADATTGVPFLDHYDPRVVTPLAEMPPGPGGSFLLLPGAYDFWGQSYCLHAGSHAPGHGNGYLYAPLKGPGGALATHILANSADHPEVPQRDIQLLLWALLARTKFDDLSPRLQETATTLLSPDEIKTLRGSFLERIPGAKVGTAFLKVPPELRQILEAEANLRNLFADKIDDYTRFEDVAVVDGDPPPSRDDREVPSGRWSYSPAGYFVAYFPAGYTSTLTQVSCPGPLTVGTDPAGRITKIINQRGDQISAQYQGDPSAVAGDTGVKISNLTGLQFSDAAGRRLELPTPGYVLTGLPSGKGSPSASTAGLPARYAWSVAHRREVEDLVGKVCQSVGSPVSADVKARALARLVDLGNFAEAAREALAARAEQEDQTNLLLANPAYEAWQALVMDLGQGQVPEALASAPRTARRPSFRWALGFASSSTPLALAALTHTIYGARRLRDFRPARSVAQPGATGRQRLAQSGRGLPTFVPKPKPKRDDDTPAYQDTYHSKDILKRTKEAMDMWSGWCSLGDLVGGGPAMWLVNKAVGAAGMDFQGGLRDGLLGTILTLAGGISQALGGDPPRPDFDQIALPQPVEVVLYEANEDLSAERVTVANEMVRALADLYSKLLAAQITRDRLGGALAADNQAAADRQAQALVSLKRQSGQAMLVLADKLEALVAPIDRAAFPTAAVAFTPEEVNAARDWLRAEGFSPGRQEAFRRLGLTAAQIQAFRQRALDFQLGDLPNTLPEDGDMLINALRDLGTMWMSLPPPGNLGDG